MGRAYSFGGGGRTAGAGTRQCTRAALRRSYLYFLFQEKISVVCLAATGALPDASRSVQSEVCCETCRLCTLSVDGPGREFLLRGPVTEYVACDREPGSVFANILQNGSHAILDTVRVRT